MNKRVLTCNHIFIFINILLFLLTDLVGIFIDFSWIETYGLSWREVFQNKEIYRLITSMFLHADLDHIFNNTLVLLMIGDYMEQQIGSLRYFILYFSTGIIAGFTSMVYNMFQNSYTISIGASGAIFGLIGALLMTVIFQRGRHQEFNLRQMLFMVFFSLYGGFTSQGVDNAAHIGGFLGGMLLTTIMCLKERRDTETCYK